MLGWETNFNSRENITLPLIITSGKVFTQVEKSLEMEKCSGNGTSKSKETRYRKVHDVVTLPLLMVFTLRHNIKESVATLRVMPGLDSL